MANFSRQRWIDCSEIQCLRTAPAALVASTLRCDDLLVGKSGLLYLAPPQVEENLTYLWSKVRTALQDQDAAYRSSLRTLLRDPDGWLMLDHVPK